jgi:hypothetical protein
MDVVGSRTALAAIANPLAGATAFLSESGREGLFVYRAANLATQVASDPQQGVYVVPQGGSSGQGAWVRDLSGKALTPYHFGAVDGTADSFTALQAFGDFIAVNAVDEADVTGDFSTHTGLVWGPVTAYGMVGKTPGVRGDMRLTARQGMQEVLRLRNWQECTWNGHLAVRGTGGSTFASRTCGVGLAFEGCRLLNFTGGITVSYFGFAGIAQIAASNNNFMQLGTVKCYLCGSGLLNSVVAGVSLTGGWQTLTDSTFATGVNSTTQRTTIGGVTTFFPSWMEDYGAVGQYPFQVRIGETLYFVTDLDRNAGTMNVFPWVRNPLGDTDFEWVLGGGVYLAGADGNVVTFDKIDATTSGRALAAASGYGPIGTVSAQGCGTGVLIGRSPFSIGLGSNLSVYMEGNAEDVVVLCAQGNAGYNYITSEYALNLAKCRNASAPRSYGDSFHDPGFVRVPIVAGGRRHEYEKRAGNLLAVASAISLVVNRRDMVLREKKDGWTINLQPIDADLNRLFGYSGASLIFHGTGANGAPTGTFTFNAPSGGTVNGGASASFSGFTRPAMFSAEYIFATLDWDVRLLNG